MSEFPKPADIPEPGHQDLLNLAHTEERSALLSKDVPESNKNEILESLRRKWYAGHKVEHTTEPAANSDIQPQQKDPIDREPSKVSEMDVPTPDKWLPVYSGAMGGGAYSTPSKPTSLEKPENAAVADQATEVTGETQSPSPLPNRSILRRSIRYVIDHLSAGIHFSFSHLWRWPWVAAVAAILIGTGGNALFGGDIPVARVLIYAAIAFVAVRAIAEVKDHEKRVGEIVVVCVLGAICIVGCEFLITAVQTRQKEQAGKVQPVPQATMSPIEVKPQPTAAPGLFVQPSRPAQTIRPYYDLFVEPRDALFGMKEKEFPYQAEGDKNQVEILCRLDLPMYDLPTLSIYIPRTANVQSATNAGIYAVTQLNTIIKILLDEIRRDETKALALKAHPFKVRQVIVYHEIFIDRAPVIGALRKQFGGTYEFRGPRVQPPLRST